MPTRAHGATGVASTTIAPWLILPWAANAGLAAPNARAATDAANAMRTARVIGATLILRLRRVLADPPECFMPLI